MVKYQCRTRHLFPAQFAINTKTKKMKLINGNALVEILKKEKVLASGIILADDNNLISDDEGIVIAVDLEVSHIVTVGDKVKFKPNSGHDMEYEGKRCKFLKVFDKDSPRTDIIGVYGTD